MECRFAIAGEGDNVEGFPFAAHVAEFGLEVVLGLGEGGEAALASALGVISGLAVEAVE